MPHGCIVGQTSTFPTQREKPGAGVEQGFKGGPAPLCLACLQLPILAQRQSLCGPKTSE